MAGPRKAARSFDLADFGLQDMLRCGRDVHEASKSAPTMEQAAQAVVSLIHDAFRDPQTTERSCALVRFFKTHPYGELEPALQEIARRALAQPPTATMRCLTLLASAGDRPEWTSRRESRGHQAIPLQTAEMVHQAPMISQLIQQFGIDVEALVSTSSGLVGDTGRKTYNVFHVQHAVGSPHIPAQQEFVVPNGIRSVLGVGGSLTNGELFALIIFSRVEIPPESASRFRNVALDIKASMFGFGPQQVFLSV